MEKRNNIFSLALAFLIGILLSNCSDTKPAQETPAKLLVFVDKTLSNQPSESRINHFRTFVAKQVKNSLQHNGDCVEGYFIHENTAGASPFLKTDEIPHFEPPTHGGGKTKEQATNVHSGRISSVRTKCNGDLKDALAKENTHNTRQQTDLWALFEVMSRSFDDLNYDRKDVYILSDMEESMPGTERRDFYKKPLESKVQAIELAKADAIAIRNLYHIDSQLFENVSVYICSPFDEMEQSNFTLNYSYWEALLAEFGVTTVKRI